MGTVPTGDCLQYAPAAARDEPFRPAAITAKCAAHPLSAGITDARPSPAGDRGRCPDGCLRRSERTMTRLTAILAGATGLVGGECLRQLLASSRYERVIVVTRRDLGPEVRHDKLRQVVVEFDKLGEARPRLRGDHVYCALGASRSSSFFYSRVKGEMEEGLRQLGWPSLAILRPSVIAGERTESRPLERVTEHLLRFAPATWRPVAARDIAAAMIATALREPPGVTVLGMAGGRIVGYGPDYQITSDAVTDLMP